MSYEVGRLMMLAQLLLLQLHRVPYQWQVQEWVNKYRAARDVLLEQSEYRECQGSGIE